MAKKIEKVAGEAVEEVERNPIFEGARKLVLASVGAVALSMDEIEDFIDRLVERGEIVEKDARKLIKEVDKRRKGTEQQMDKRLDDILGRMNVPTKADIDALSTKIAALTQKVEELKKAQA